jgi:DNA-binding NarL/FixJ family response regulator
MGLEPASPPTQPLRILIVDDSLLFRRFIHWVLGQKEDCQIVGEAIDGMEAVQKAEELKPDLVLLDIGLTKLNGLQAAKQIGQVAPNSKIMFVTMHSDADIVQAGLSNGAVGYVLKSDAGSELLPAIEAVLEGKRYVSSGLDDGWHSS